MTTKADLIHFYQNNAGYFVASERGNENHLLAESHRRVLAYVASLSGKRVCEFGCGSGANIREMYNEDNKYVGVDVSRSALEEARRKYDYRNIEYVRASGDYPLSCSGGSFDIIISFLRSSIYSNLVKH